MPEQGKVFPWKLAFLQIRSGLGNAENLIPLEEI